MNNMEKKTAMRIILLFAFFMSQGLTWKVVAWLNQSAQWSEKTYLIFQIEGACIYTFLCIYFTKDKLLVANFGENVPFLPKIVDILISIFSWIFVWGSKFYFLMAEIFSISSHHDEVKLIKRNAIEEIESYKNSNIYVRALVGIGGLTIVIMFISVFVPQETIEIVSDIMKVILNIVLFTIVCANVDIFTFSKDLDNKNK